MLFALLFFYLIVFVLLFLAFLLLDDDKHSFGNAMIILASLILWPLVVLWYLTESIRNNAPVERDLWL
jgi:peptidoglycan/LPS O-acetylase OafA/YrhL